MTKRSEPFFSFLFAFLSHFAGICRDLYYGAAGQNRPCSSAWGWKQEKFQRSGKFFLLTSSPIERFYYAGRESAFSMVKTFKRGDHVEWNSEAGRVRGVILKKVVSDVRIKGYVHHASKKEPQYFIKSNKTDHVAIHKGKALKIVKAQTSRKPSKIGKRRDLRR